MAKRKQSVSFSKAIIDMENMTITEINKDDERTYDLRKVLNSFDNIEGISFSISADSELPDISTGGVSDD